MKRYTAQDRVGNIEQIECPQCKTETKHTIQCSHESHWSVCDGNISGGGWHDLMTCNGCGTVTYRSNTWCTEDQEKTITYFPPRGQDPRSPRFFEGLAYGSPLEAVYRQTITAFNQQLFTLAGAGVRLIIEGICNEQGIKGGELTDDKGNLITNKKTGKVVRGNNLVGKINGMVEHGLIAKRQAAVLHQIRFLGNDAAHDLYVPPREVVKTALDIVEHLMTQVYEQPEHAKALAERKRPKKK